MDTVRVLKIVEYVGNRDWVEATLKNSLKPYSKFDGKGVIKTAIIDSYPEVLGTEVEGIVGNSDGYLE